MPAFLKFVGQFHPAIVHLPIAMLVIAAFAEILRWRRPGPFFENVAAFNLHIGALSGVAAAAMGWCLAETEGVAADLKATLFWHRWLGIGVAVLAVALVLLWRSNRVRPTAVGLAVYRAGLLGGALLVSITGHLGGTLVFGLDWYQWSGK